MTFGQRLRNARKNKGLTQKQLADLINAKHNSVSDWENDKNKPDPDTIEYICGALDIPVSFLFSESVQNKNSPESHEMESEELHPLLAIFYDLNPEGQEKLMEYAQDLSDMPKYKKCSTFSKKAIG